MFFITQQEQADEMITWRLLVQQQEQASQQKQGPAGSLDTPEAKSKEKHGLWDLCRS
jgi:hypothetical protein